jgi:hypothetical protein
MLGGSREQEYEDESAFAIACPARVVSRVSISDSLSVFARIHSLAPRQTVLADFRQKALVELGDAGQALRTGNHKSLRGRWLVRTDPAEPARNSGNAQTLRQSLALSAARIKSCSVEHGNVAAKVTSTQR